MRLLTFKTSSAAAIGLALTAAPAFAHHAMDGETPATFMQGLFSGLAHPVIGFDHLAFIIGVGLLAAVGGFGPLLPAVFVVSMLGGMALHFASINPPGVELLIAASVALIGLAILRPRPTQGSWIEGGLFALAGVFHGYAFAESIIGAETAPLAAYFAGLIFVQSAIALGAYYAARFLFAEPRRLSPWVVRAAGAAIFAVGAFFAAQASGLIA